MNDYFTQQILIFCINEQLKKLNDKQLHRLYKKLLKMNEKKLK